MNSLVIQNKLSSSNTGVNGTGWDCCAVIKCVCNISVKTTAPGNIREVNYDFALRNFENLLKSICQNCLNLTKIIGKCQN